MAKKKAKKVEKKLFKEDPDRPDPWKEPGPNNELEIPGCIGDAVAFVSDGTRITVRVSASPYQCAKLIKSVVTACAAKKGKYHKYQHVMDDLENMLLDADFRVRAHLFLGMKDLDVKLPATSGEIVPTGWADPRPDNDSEEV